MRRGPGGGPLRPLAPPLVLDFSPEGRAALRQAQTWLKGFSTEVLQRFTTTLSHELKALCKACAVNPPTQPHEQATIYYSRPVFAHRFQTGKTKTKRSSSGVWFVIFDLQDTNGDARPDLLRIVTIFHAASQAPWDEQGEEESA
ncbi:hypothetical protein [Armatimonas rosea]|uniref:Uncharacterized protein n=1 Tax=Armatimonas rosea TaxID=685828 RepID=A0A7W9SUA5_ARMRO|nr:hypothetical protein [Armatimonas rosea]MBB6052946.1 hypothetical protein [Armatimonas rosea]